jgi:hypothetical protein
MGATLNLIYSARDQGWKPQHRGPLLGGNQSVKTIRPNTTDPIPLRNSPPKMGTIMVRFVVLLVVAVGLLALVWSR